LFRNNAANVVQWLTRFGAFLPHEHRISVALAGGAFVLSPRQTTWIRLPARTETQSSRKCVTVEEPCDYPANHLERNYPLKTPDLRHDRSCVQYKAVADIKATFIGRCSTCQYLDTHQVINQSLRGVHAWMDAA